MNKLGLIASLEDSYRRRIIHELKGLSGARFERFGDTVIDRICHPTEMLHRGLNVEGAPVKKVIDSTSSDTLIAAQYSSEAGYFAADAEKPKADYLKVKLRHPSARTIHLLANDNSPVNVTSFQEWAKTQGALDHIKVETWDARRIADLLIDNLHDDAFSAVMGDWLPCVNVFRQEYAFSQMLPRLRSEYVHRLVEGDIAGLVRANLVTVIFGLSGAGKSDLCCAVAWTLKPEFETVVWMDARSITRAENLASASIHRYGASINLLGLLQRQRVLLVLDNLDAALDPDAFGLPPDATSRVLITRQSSVPGGFNLPGLSLDETRQLLQSGGHPCPETILEEVRRKTGGHALTLAVLDKLAGRYGWAEVAEDLGSIGDVVDDASQSKLRHRVLGRIETLIPAELDFLRWCGSSEIDKGLARHVLRIGGISNLTDLNVLTTSTDDILKFHELVFTFATLTSVDALRAESFKKMFLAYLQLVISAKQAPLYACIFRHRDLISKLVSAGERDPRLFYAYIASGCADNISLSFVSDLEGSTNQLLYEFPTVPLHLKALAVIEAIEHEYILRLNNSHDDAIAFAKSTLHTFDILLEMASISDDISLLLHHKAKALKRSGDKPAAEGLYRTILASACPLHQSRLQLSRMLERRGEGDEAAQLMKEILQSAKDSSASVSITVILEVFGTLRHRHLLRFRDAFAREFSDIAFQAIENTIATGFEQPYLAVASLASYWAEHNPDLLSDLVKRLPPPPSSLFQNDSGKAAVAEVYVHAAALLEVSDPSLANTLRSEVRNMMSAVQRPSPFFTHLNVRALIGLNKPEEALAILGSSPKADDLWANVWRACIFDALGRFPEAETCVAYARAQAHDNGIRLWMVERSCRRLFALDA